MSGIDRHFWRSRVEDMRRHLADLRHDWYEGAESHEARQEVFLRAFDLVTPVAEVVLGDMNDWLLEGRGRVHTQRPEDDGSGGLSGGWTLTWPRLERATNVHTRHPLRPVTIAAIYPRGWTHGHLARLHTGLPAEVTAWPLQVLDEADAWRQEPVLRILAEAELHERVYQAGGDWRLVAGLDTRAEPRRAGN